ncbi:VanZ family protein [Rhodocytophaga aerolata]|uniref:VanZ family protein n=1 Tax=Rhodocytophaga aerolata TaxID=455078 RepID=A0ABT8REP3_9BACT|nr:VanZ family protein [Rhodocytophaga aerolata]MDO1450161.1 VanZ family protein [Rhodocytophaga aerolata]
MKEQSKVDQVTHRLTTGLFIIYLIALYWILLLKFGVRFSYMGNRTANLIPFSQQVFLTSENILNVIIFVPLGIYAGILFERWLFGKKLLFFFLLSLLVEALQYILRIGVFDVTDLVTNTVGAVIGLIIVKGLDKAFNDRAKSQKFINLIAATGTFVLILLFVLLKMELLPIKYQ